MAENGGEWYILKLDFYITLQTKLVENEPTV